MHLDQLAGSLFAELTGVLHQLSDTQYTHPSTRLSGGTIGQHVRHSIELFQCLLKGYYSGTVNYEERKRDLRLQTDRLFASHMLQVLEAELDKKDRPLFLATSFGEAGNDICVQSNYYRELIYNLEHTIHHMALIRVGIEELTDILLPETFGIAPSTIQYRKACAQ